jgi:hypothetical protein
LRGADWLGHDARTGDRLANVRLANNPWTNVRLADDWRAYIRLADNWRMDD